MEIIKQDALSSELPVTILKSDLGAQLWARSMQLDYCLNLSSTQSRAPGKFTSVSSK